jgi:ribulose-5-phosphate 4-epimerase/fuculose-1-phosphate aldolase
MARNAGAAARRLKCSPAEWQVRVDLAACYRLIHRFGLTDLVYNHATAKVPGENHHYLINPYGHAYDEITASNLVKIDAEGRIVDDSPHEINPAGFVIHSAVHEARTDAICVIHTHSRAVVAVSCLKDGFIPMTQAGFQFHNRIAYHDYQGFAVDDAEKRDLVRDLGPHKVMMLRNHGVLTLGRSVAEAFRRLYYIEQACQVQMDTLQMGRPIIQPPEEVMEHTARQWEGGAAGIGTDTLREWPALLRMLDRIDPTYKN